MGRGQLPARTGRVRSARRRRLALSAVLILAWAFWPAPAEPAALPKLALSASRDSEPGATLGALQRCGEIGSMSVVAPALTVDFGDSGPTALDLGAVERVLHDFPASRKVLLHLRIHVAPSTPVNEAGTAALEGRVAQIVAALPLESGSVGGVILEVAPSPGDLAVLQFTLARLVLQLKASKPLLGPIAVVFPPRLVRQEESLARRVAAYADTIGVGYGTEWRGEAEWVRDELGKPVALRVGPDAVRGADGLAAAYLDVVAETGDALIDTLWAEGPTAEQAATLCQSNRVLSDTLGPSFLGTRMDLAPATLGADGDPVVASAFVDSSSTSSAFLVRAGGSPALPRRITVSARGEGALELDCRSALDGRKLATHRLQAPGETKTEECVGDAPYVVMAVHRQGEDQRTYEWVSVTGRGGLRVEEIVARWQKYRAAQQLELDNLTADCLLSLHFEATALGAGFDVALELRQFVDRSGQSDWVQRGFLVNGVRFGNPRGFALPQLEPEKVLAQPLELALKEKYRYALLGTDTVDGILSYVISVEPEDPKAVLFTGKVWIDGSSFRQVRMQLQQRGGRSSVLSHVETQEYHLVPSAGGRQFNLLHKITAQQLVSAAGRSLLVERIYSFSGYQINSPGFGESRAKAMASDLRMYRDTNEGLRVLRREGDSRVVEPAKRRVRSLLGGVMYDGSYDFPIPLAGLSLVDYDFRRTGAELSLFFAGPIIATNLSKHAGERFRYGMDLALSAIPQKNRVFDGSDEVIAQGLWGFEETVGVLASWQARPGLSLGGSSYFSLNVFRPTGDTDPDFRASGYGFTVQTSGELKLTRSGFTLTGTVLQGDRLGWPELGRRGGDSAAPAASFRKYSGEASKQFYIAKFTKAGVSASYYGGERLDRFSRYQPSFLSRLRIRGIPGGTDTFDAIGVAGVQLGFNALDAVWVEGMYNHAWGRNLDESSRFRNFDGLELDLGTVGPWGTFVKGTVTYALQGNLDRYNSRWGVYLLVFKPLD
jgi:hypothetical protein